MRNHNAGKSKGKKKKGTISSKMEGFKDGDVGCTIREGQVGDRLPWKCSYAMPLSVDNT